KLVGTKLPNNRDDFAVWCYVRPEEAANAWNTARGQTIKFKGKCTDGGTLLTYVSLKSCRIESKGPDVAVTSTAPSLLAEYAKSADSANERFKDKEVLINTARLVSLSGDVAIFSGSTAKGGTVRLQVRFSFGQQKKLDQLKVGQSVRFRA